MKILFFFMMVVLSVTGCSRDRHDHSDLTTGEQLFNYHCAECHMEKGTGSLFEGIPANIKTSKTPHEIVTYMTTQTDGQRKMPVFSHMPLREAKLIATHLMKLQDAYEKSGGAQIKQFLINP